VEVSREPNDIRESSLYNEDLALGPQSRRDWGVYNYASLWVGMSEGPARIRIPSALGKNDPVALD
jgi:NCS1 family nucleobase:cation symporter-1